MKTRLFAVLVALALTVTLASGMVAAQDGPSGEIVIALANDPTSLYGPRGADVTAGNALRPLYDTLLFLADDGELIPWLAESFEVSEDGLEYTFQLREGITFHNGEAFTAEDVVATWEFGSDSSNDFAQDYVIASSVEAIDDFTVKMTTAEPSPLFLTRLASEWQIIPSDYIREVGVEGFEQAPVGTGPFVFVDRISGDRIVYEANPNYWQEGMPKVQQVTFRIIPDPSTRVAAVQTGEIDIANRLTPEEAALMEGASNVGVITYPNDRVYYAGFKNVGNGAGTPLEDVRVRQALNYAVNSEAIIASLFNGEANMVNSFVVSSNLGYDENVPFYEYNPELAMELLAEAGYEEGFEISMGCPTDAYVNINEVCLVIQRDLGAVGVDVSVEFKTSNAYWSEPEYGSVGPIYVDSWSSAVGEGLPRLEGSLIPGNYYTTWEDENIVNFINEIGATVDRQERADLYSELQAYMFENPPYIYLYQPNIFEAVNTRVEGYAPRANESYYLNEVSVTN